MSTLRFQREREGRTVTLRIEGTFDGQGALALGKLLDELDGDEVVLDFSRVREFFDLALAALTQAVRNRPVKMRGLRTHQERMFRYLGFESMVVPSVPSVAAYYTPEDAISA